MTRDQKAKRAVRARMAGTGEKYTVARRALGGGGVGQQLPGATDDPGDPIGWFTDQGYNAILLAEDEARMLGQALVEPEHLLLAAARTGNVERVLAVWNIRSGGIYSALLRPGGLGTELVLGRVPRSRAADRVLWQAIAAAHERGVVAPSTQHLLLGLQEEDVATAVLRELGLTDVSEAVDTSFPVTRPPVPGHRVAKYAVVARSRQAPRPGPIPPVFERFTREAHRSIELGIESARSLDNKYVTPAHLVHGLLDSEAGVVADVLARHEQRPRTTTTSARETPVDRRPRATGIFTDEARQLVAERVLSVAGGLGHHSLSTGHLLLAVLESPDDETREILKAIPDAEQILTEVRDALPGSEHH